MYTIVPINTSTGLVAFELDLSGTGIKYLEGADVELQIQIDTMDAKPIPLAPGGMIAAPFTRLFITGSGDQIVDLLIYLDKLFLIDNPLKRGATPVIFNKACAAADTEISQAISTSSGRNKTLVLFARGGDIHYGWNGGDSTTKYRTILQGTSVSLDIDDANRTIYFQSPVAGAVLEIEVWG